MNIDSEEEVVDGMSLKNNDRDDDSVVATVETPIRWSDDNDEVVNPQAIGALFARRRIVNANIRSIVRVKMQNCRMRKEE